MRMVTYRKDKFSFQTFWWSEKAHLYICAVFLCSFYKKKPSIQCVRFKCNVFNLLLIEWLVYINRAKVLEKLLKLYENITSHE